MRGRRIVLAGLVGALGLSTGVGRAFTAPAPGPAGEAVAAPSGYAISAVRYGLGADGRAIGRVSFRIAPAAASTVEVRLAPDQRWQSCRDEAGLVTCELSRPVPIPEALVLQVTAAS